VDLLLNESGCGLNFASVFGQQFHREWSLPDFPVQGHSRVVYLRQFGGNFYEKGVFATFAGHLLVEGDGQDAALCFFRVGSVAQLRQIDD
jgi:hypothetical protein